jgi:cleavage and polyadenylation specificity factor subunit 3
MIQFLALGGAGEIGASCYHLSFENTGIILDSGIHPQRTGIAALPLFDLLDSLPVDTILISHAHQDHLASLPYLIQRHPYSRILTTPQTRAIAELTLHNSVAILQEQLKDDLTLHPYRHEEIDLLIQSIEWKSYNEVFSIDGYRSLSGTPVSGCFTDAGHILGSAGIWLEHEDRKVFYTGDIKLLDQSIQTGADIPEGPIDLLIMECTHGGTDSVNLPPWSTEGKRLAGRANQVLDSGSAVLIPVFSLGKMQEMLSIIWNLMGTGTLSRTEIYTAGIGRRINSVYDKNRYVVRRRDPEFELGIIPQNDIYELDHFDDLVRTPSIVLAPSGMMLEGTLSYKAAQTWSRNSKSAIFIVGYMDPQTPGYSIASAKRGDHVQMTPIAEPIEIKCSVDKFRFSSHATREGLLHIVKKLSPRQVILIHGDDDATIWMKSSITNSFPGVGVFIADPGKPVTLE